MSVKNFNWKHLWWIIPVIILIVGCITIWIDESQEEIMLPPGKILWEVYDKCSELNCLEIQNEKQYSCPDGGQMYCAIKNNCKEDVVFKVCEG